MKIRTFMGVKRLSKTNSGIQLPALFLPPHQRKSFKDKKFTRQILGGRFGYG
ncbi:MAG: hypothetical protein JJU29_19225 [Verrucomicrobia bacterium]|nr:hypothetical protein [Verrucomicrobiota bacterium]MCH8511225.1 hypothetical protein [Kiritimatiellia bacterium]